MEVYSWEKEIGMVGVDKASDDPVESALTLFTPLIGQLSFGSMVGYTSGYALKKIGKMAAFVIGAGFIFLQSMAAAGYIEVDWMKIKDTTVAKLDTDGDGIFGASDMKEYWRRFKRIMTSKLPDGAGFSLGFFYGIKHG